MTKKRKQLLQSGEKGVGLWRDKVRTPSGFLDVAPRDSTASDATWVRDLSEAGPTHHSGLGKLGKDYWVTENQELLLLVMVCICEVGTVVQSALGGGG